MSEKNKPQDAIVNPTEFVYLGFGQRVLASIIDTITQMLILTPTVILFFPHLLSVNLPYDLPCYFNAIFAGFLAIIAIDIR